MFEERIKKYVELEKEDEELDEKKIEAKELIERIIKEHKKIKTDY